MHNIVPCKTTTVVFIHHKWGLVRSHLTRNFSEEHTFITILINSFYSCYKEVMTWFLSINFGDDEVSFYYFIIRFYVWLVIHQILQLQIAVVRRWIWWPAWHRAMSTSDSSSTRSFSCRLLWSEDESDDPLGTEQCLRLIRYPPDPSVADCCGQKMNLMTRLAQSNVYVWFVIHQILQL